jgi:hypothetical protein
VVLDPDGIIRHYEYDEWHMIQAALVAEHRRQEESEVAEHTYAEVGREIEGNKELGEAELEEKMRVGEDELREKRWTGYEVMAESKRIVAEGAAKRDQIGAEYADERREIREAREDIEYEYEDGEEVQEFVEDVEVWEYWEEETMYEEENIREKNVEGNLDFAEDRTKYRSKRDHSHSTTVPQDYDEMVFKFEVNVHFHDSTDESIEHPDPGTKPSSQIFEVVEEEEGDEGEAARYIEVRDKAGEEEVKGMWGFREIDLQEKTEMVHVDVEETRRIEESVQEIEKVGEGNMGERREMGEARRDVEVEKFGYRETVENVESILEALEVGFEETRYVDKNTGEMHLNEKQITETTMEHVLYGGYVRDAVDTHRAGQYLPRGPAGNDALGSSTNKDVEYPGQAVKPSKQKNGKQKEVNRDVGGRDVEETREVGRKIKVNQKAGKEKVKDRLSPIDVETQKGAGMGHMEIKEGKEMRDERMQDREKKGKEKGKGLREVGKKRKHFEVQEKSVNKKVGRDIGENMEVAQANTAYMGEKAGDKKSKGKSKLPDDKMKHRLEGDHAQDTKERSQKSYHIELKLDGSIRIYRYTGRHM